MNRLFNVMTKKRQHTYEYCVLCHSETPYFYDTDIRERNFYIIGCGQLCFKCFNAVNKNEAELLDIYSFNEFYISKFFMQNT